MNWETITGFIEIAGLIAVVVSLFYIGVQTKQTNEHVTASAEIDFIDSWNQILNSWISDERTTNIIRRGFYSFKNLEPSEQAVFHMRVNALINQWLVIKKLHEKNLVAEDFFVEATNVVVSTLSTPGGFEFLEHDWKLLPNGAEIMKLVKDRKDRTPSLTDVFPWWSDPRSA